MNHKWEDIRKKRTPEEEAESEAWVAAELAKLPNQQICRAKELTRERLAELLELDPEAVARMEHWTDIYLSTFRSYIEAQGGAFELSVRFAGYELLVQKFNDIPSVHTEGQEIDTKGMGEKEPASAPAA